MSHSGSWQGLQHRPMSLNMAARCMLRVLAQVIGHTHEKQEFWPITWGRCIAR